MIKIRLYELEKHRNETTFRPFLFSADLFREVGIEFTSSDDYDYAFDNDDVTMMGWLLPPETITKSITISEF